MGLHCIIGGIGIIRYETGIYYTPKLKDFVDGFKYEIKNINYLSSEQSTNPITDTYRWDKKIYNNDFKDHTLEYPIKKEKVRTIYKEPLNIKVGDGIVVTKKQSLINKDTLGLVVGVTVDDIEIGCMIDGSGLICYRTTPHGFYRRLCFKTCTCNK